MRRSATEFARVISRALIADSNPTAPYWNPSLEQTLHRVKCRDSLNPTLVARVIDPFLIQHHSLAFGFFNWASQQPGFAHNSETYNSVLKSLSNSRQFNSIDKLLKQVRVNRITLEPSVYGSIIASLIAWKRIHLAFTVFCEVGSVIGPDVCNSLLAGLASEGSIERAQKVFDEMLHRGVRLNTLGFGVFVWWVCRKKGFEEVLCLLDKGQEVDFSGVDGSIVALLVAQGLCEGKKGKEAICALEKLRIRGCKPDFMAYRIVAETLREMGYVVEVELVLKRKRKLGVAPRANDYREYIFQLVSEKLIREAKELGEVIVSGNFPIEDDVLNVLIGSVSNIDPLRAVSFLKFMLEKEKVPTLLTLINLSDNLCKHEKSNELVEVFQLLSKIEYFKNLESYNVMISFLGKGGRVKEGYQVLQAMKMKGFIPDVKSYNYLLEACCREDLVRPAKRLYDEMFANGCCGNLETYNILIRKFIETGYVEDACHLFHHMFAKELVPDSITYTSLLEGLCRVKKLELAIEVFDKCIEQDKTLAESLLSTFTICLCKQGFFRPASELLCGLACRIRCLNSHLTLLNYFSEIGELALATEHINLVVNKSPELLSAIQSELSASLSSSLNQEPILWMLREMAKFSDEVLTDDLPLVKLS